MFAKPVGSLELVMESGEGAGEHAASSQSEQTAFVGLRKFQQIRPTVLGAIEVSIGIIMTLTAISFLIARLSNFLIIAVAYWGIIIGCMTHLVLLYIAAYREFRSIQKQYIPAGAITIATDTKLTKAMVWATLVLNVLAAISAFAGIVLHFIFGIVAVFPSCREYCNIETNTELVMAVFSIVLFIVSILAAAFATAALCSQCSSGKQLKHTKHTGN